MSLNSNSLLSFCQFESSIKPHIYSSNEAIAVKPPTMRVGKRSTRPVCSNGMNTANSSTIKSTSNIIVATHEKKLSGL